MKWAVVETMGRKIFYKKNGFSFVSVEHTSISTGGCISQVYKLLFE